MSATSQEQVCPARGFDGSPVLIGVRSGTINGGRRAACCADDPPHDIGAATMGERMQGKTALVTGATSNIGRAIAIAFAAEGANVVVSGRSASRGGEVVQEIRRAGGHAQFVAADLDGSARAHGSCLPQLWMLSAAGSTCSSTAPASFRAQPRRLSTKRCSTRSTRSTSRRRSSSPLRSMTARGS